MLGLATSPAFGLPVAVRRVGEVLRALPARAGVRTRLSLVTAAAVSGLFGAYLAGGELARGDHADIFPIEELAKLPGRREDPAATKLSPVAGDAARQSNASVAYASGDVIPAPGFVFAGTDGDRARAVDCLALAAMAEAGASDPGQRAVIQVVLNRVRHPAFAKSICGVVFQGSERATGCQFTFTCDGSLARRYSGAAWSSARARAEQAIAGTVYAPVGAATHYHTDWVYPYWSPSLLKLARVDTHLFFRWPGHWGNAAALSSRYRGGEPSLRALAMLAAHGDARSTDQAGTAALLSAAGADGAGSLASAAVVRNADGGGFVQVPRDATVADLKDLARSICAGRQGCKVMGWADANAIPAAYPISPPARAKLSFSYFTDQRGGEVTFYDCKRFAGVSSSECIPLPRPLPGRVPIVTAGTAPDPAAVKAAVLVKPATGPA